MPYWVWPKHSSLGLKLEQRSKVVPRRRLCAAMVIGAPIMRQFFRGLARFIIGASTEWPAYTSFFSLKHLKKNLNVLNGVVGN